MSLLDRALNIAQKAYNYVVGNHNSSSNEIKGKSNNKPNSAVRPNEEFVGTVGDTLVKETDTDEKAIDFAKNEKKAIVSQQDIEDKIKEIDKKCKKFNIKYEECIENILSNMDFSIEEFNKLSNSQKLKTLNLIDSALSAYIADKYMYDPNVDVSSLIGQSAKNLDMAINEGGIKNHKEFKKYTKEVNAQLIEKLSNAKTEEERVNIISEFRKEFRANIENERQQALKKCKNKDEIEKVNHRYNRRIEALESQNATEFTAKSGAKNAYLSTYFVDGKNYAKANINSIRLFNTKGQIIAASSYTHERRMNALKHAHESGDPISAKTYGEAIQYTAQYMSYDALEQFEADAYKFRLENKNNLPEYITQEHLTAESASLGAGALLNENISAEDKAKFIKNWDEHAQKFDDYDEVRRKCYETITEHVKKHPETKNLIEKFNSAYHKKYGETPALPRSAAKRYGIELNQTNNPKYNTQNNKSAEKATSQQIEHALTYMSYDEARKQFSQNTEKEFAEVVISNPKLKGHKHNILPYIKSLPDKELGDIMKDSYGEMYLFILRNINPEKAGKLYDETRKDKGYAVRTLGEKVVEESRA